MSTQIDWQAELDRAIEQVPGRPAAAYVATGRRAVRRRRAAVSVAGLASAVLVGGLGWAVLPADGPAGSEPSVAGGGPSAPTTSAPEPDGRDEQGPGGPEDPWPDGQPPARFVPEVGVQVRPGTVVHERREDVRPGSGTESVALDATYGGDRWWILLEWDAEGSTAEFVIGDEASGSFDDFVAEQVAGGDERGDAAGTTDEEFLIGGLASWSVEGLRLRDDVTLVRRVDNPHGVTAPHTSVGLVLEHDGTTTWLSLLADANGSTGAVEDADASGWLTFDQWLAADVARQAGEPGLQLVTMDDRGALEQGERGAVILDAVPDPDVPGHVTATTTASAAARVAWRGETWFVLVVRDREEAEDVTVTFAAAKAGGADTVGEFLDFLARRADEGGTAGDGAAESGTGGNGDRR